MFVESVNDEVLRAIEPAEPPTPEDPSWVCRGIVFDGLIWGEGAGNDAQYAGLTYNRLRQQADRGWHRFGNDESPLFPRATEVFGRTSTFAWRGDTLRGIDVREIEDPSQPGFWIGMEIYDTLVGLITDPARSLTELINAPASIRFTREPLSGSEADYRLHARNEGMEATLVVRFDEASEAAWPRELIYWGKDHASNNTYLYHVWLSPAEIGRSLPSRPEDLRSLYASECPSIEDAGFVDYTTIGPWQEGTVRYMALSTLGADVMRWFITALLSGLLLAVFHRLRCHRGVTP